MYMFGNSEIFGRMKYVMHHQAGDSLENVSMLAKHKLNELEEVFQRK
jgi:hypothetical protein